MVLKSSYPQQIPALHLGWQSQFDRFIGPGTTSAEIGVKLVPSVITAIAAPLLFASTPGLE